MFCENCGTSLPNDARFCGNCGSAVTPLAQAAPPVATPMQQQPRPQQQTRPQQPTTAAPAYAQQRFRQPVPGGGPVPPDMHWLVVLIIAWFTCGLGAIVWGFRQAAFVKRIDPSSKAVMMMVLTLVFILVQAVLQVLAMASRGDGLYLLVPLILLLNIVIVVTSLCAIFGMRGSLNRYYTTVEPIGLQLNGFLTFLFSILYLQYHLSRIAEWKRTGRLS